MSDLDVVKGFKSCVVIQEVVEEAVEGKVEKRFQLVVLGHRRASGVGGLPIFEPDGTRELIDAIHAPVGSGVSIHTHLPSTPRSGAMIHGHAPLRGGSPRFERRMVTLTDDLWFHSIGAGESWVAVGGSTVFEEGSLPSSQMRVCLDKLDKIEIHNAALVRRRGGRFGLVLVVAALSVFVLSVAAGELVNRLNDPVSA